jgi:3-hydroxyisobutyrate dehydrogenase-like beta-hydroxyacid dehydrogenase
MKIGFVGLGNMGQAMARNLCSAGHTVSVYNRTRSRAEELKADGVHIVDTPADASRGDVVITMLSDDAAVEAVVLGDGGLIYALRQETVHISMSTISAALSKRLAEAHHRAGRAYVAAPVFGRPGAAAAGKLFILAAGSPEPIEKCMPVFDVLGQKTFVVSENPWDANIVKLSGNFLVASVIESLGESLALIRKYGIDQDKFLDVLTGSLFTAPVYKTYGDMMAREDYEPAGFKLPLGLKDIRLMLAAAEDIETPMPTASLIHEQFLTALARGYRELDWSSLGLLSAENAGLEVRLPRLAGERA